MDKERRIPSAEQPQEQSKEEKTQPQTSEEPAVEEQTARDPDAEKIAKEQDEARIAEIRASLGLAEKETPEKNTRQYLHEYLELKENDAEKIELLKAGDLEAGYKEQYKAMNDSRLENVNIAVVPDELWVKGSQPSESHAEKGLILMKQSYYETQEKPDEIAWMTHELAHCKNFLDSESEEEYQKNMQTFAYEDIKSEYPYPNNQVEKNTFTQQFDYLRERGKTRQDILKMLGNYYEKEDFSFFDKILDEVYS